MNKRTDWFLHDRFGMFIHWGLYAIPARGEWIKTNERMTDEQYRQYFDEFNPTDYDPKAWARAAREAGMQYAVLTTKHHDGFCLFDSALTDYKSTNTPCGRDLVREYVDAFRAEGIKIGFYYSLLDWHHPDYPHYGDQIHPMRDDPAYGNENRDFSRYIAYLHGQVRELLTNYGKLDIMWFDFSYGEMSGEKWGASELLRMVRELNPDILLDNRLFPNGEDQKAEDMLQYGDFLSPEQILPPQGMTDSKGNPVPWEACVTLNNSWGYTVNDNDYKSPRDVVRALVECVSKGGNLLLNVGPDARGRIPDESLAILREVGGWIRKNGGSIYGCGQAGLEKPEWGRYTRNGRKLYAHVLERGVGAVRLPGLGGRIVRGRLLSDGSEIAVGQPWNANNSQDDAFILFPRHRLPDELDTVVKLTLREE